MSNEITKIRILFTKNWIKCLPGETPVKSRGNLDRSLEAAGGASLVSPKTEWNMVVGGGPVGLAVEETGPECTPLTIKDRVLSPLDVYLELASRQFPGLNVEEVVALRLWTGPMHTRYNFLLRSLCVCDARGLRPCPVPGPAHYTATLLALNSAVVKLIHGPPAPHGAVYRGLRLDFFTLPDKPLDGVDPGLQAFSPDLEEASKMSCRGGREGLLLECRAAQGADVRWVSQFPKQNEVLFPAFSHVRSLGPQRCRLSGVSVWEVMLNAEGMRLEELAQEAAATATVDTRTHTLDRMHPHHTRLFFYPSPLYSAVWWSMGLACAWQQAG